MEKVKKGKKMVERYEIARFKGELRRSVWHRWWWTEDVSPRGLVKGHEKYRV